jgi:putative methyltransferase (TIGR04325 family)
VDRLAIEPNANTIQVTPKSVLAKLIPEERLDTSMGQFLRKALRTLEDIYTYRYFNSQHKAPRYRGVYPSFAAAQAALPKNRPQGFDLASVPEAFIQTHFFLSPSDYPNLFWLSQALQPATRVFDFGGAVGQSYYYYNHLIDFPADLIWTVCDVEAMARRGAEFALERKAANLCFTTDRAEADSATIFMTNGALQYIDTDLSEILASLATKPQHVIVNRVPMYDGEPYYSVQSTFHSYCTHKVMNTAQFVSAIEKLGYQKVDQWELPRSLHIPFHPERFVPHFMGFYFRREANLAS